MELLTLPEVKPRQSRSPPEWMQWLLKHCSG